MVLLKCLTGKADTGKKVDSRTYQKYRQRRSITGIVPDLFIGTYFLLQ